MRATVRGLLLWSVSIALVACVGRVSEGKVGTDTNEDGGRRSGDLGEGGLTAMQPDGDAGRGKDAGRPRPCADQPLARGMRMSEVAMYQTVKVSLFRNGAWTHAANRSAAVVQGKQSLVRAFVELQDDYEPHTVRAVLRLKEGDDVIELADTKTLEKNSTDQELFSTFNFPVSPGQIGDNTAISIALEEPNCKSESGRPEQTRYPTDGDFQSLEALFINTLKIVLVPINYQGRVPDVGPIERDKIRTTLLAYYPVPEVEITVREPLEWDQPIDNISSQTWTELLLSVIEERAADNPDRDVYYVALLQPSDTKREFCQSGCILGVAPRTERRETPNQVALSAAFPDSLNYESIVHELGHAHGRGHSPCTMGSQILGVDYRYPLSTGATDSWGWDSRTKQLMEPEVHMDVMGYCEPNWISTYTYSALVDRSKEINGDALVYGVPDVVYRHLVLYADGSARWTSLPETNLPPGNIEIAQALDAEGQALETITVRRIPLSHVDDGFAYIPKTKPGWAAIKLSDRVLQLDSIKPAH